MGHGPLTLPRDVRSEVYMWCITVPPESQIRRTVLLTAVHTRQHCVSWSMHPEYC